MIYKSCINVSRIIIFPTLFMASFMFDAMASNTALLVSTVKDTQVSNGNQDSTETVGEACATILDYINSKAYMEMSAGERTTILARLKYCMEINNVNIAVIKIVKDAIEEERNTARFRGLNWGIGIGYSQARSEIIDRAVLVNGVITPTTDRSDKVRIILESHIIIACNKSKSRTRKGCGPFLAVATGDYKTLSGAGIGWLWGWKSQDPKKTDAFSIGLGLMADDTVRTLANGFIAGQPLPAGETTIRYVKKSSCSSLIFISHSF